MPAEWLLQSIRGALRAIEDGAPRNLAARVQPDADDRGMSISSADITTVIEASQDADSVLTHLGRLIHRWDVANGEDWTEGTAPSTIERRDLICKRLGLDERGARWLLDRRPIFHDRSIVISGDWKRWYNRERASDHEFYWPRYRDYLREVRLWPDLSVAALDKATSDVLERITDPLQAEAYQSKGLVVGYVQSGKTANFTGVVAKAIDAGYRLIIVMTGTIELLRAQTQRRIDMELVGKQNITGDLTKDHAMAVGVDYQEDIDWIAGKFLDLGEDPEIEILRLTRHKADYQRQFKTLKMERFEKTVPLFSGQNLFRSNARLAIVKKNAAVLKKLVTDITANRNAFAEIPVLIIDDESDQASVNTVDPSKVARAKREGRSIEERRTINRHIASMLELMPRCQYVGYTATPFANVFVDPADDAGIFPKDFVIGLGRPDGYMGVDDFHDLGDYLGNSDPEFSNEAAYVRHLYALDGEVAQQRSELAQAIDMFVLTGAVKLHRAAALGLGGFRHHTMLVHQSVKKDDHRDLGDEIRSLWARARFTSPEATFRLRHLFETDLQPVSAVRREADVPALPTFDQLIPYISASIKKIAEHSDNPVLIVNSDSDVQHSQQSLDFDRNEVWRILVGGSKLSRGFTIEGLTVTYFRRATNMNDSLTQMGRWFGFRTGYRDLVRLYIARNARFGSDNEVDLYQAFEGIARDEEAFRSQLANYASWNNDRPQVRPIELPPLVWQHLPSMLPTAKGKMFNAVLVEQSEQGFTPVGYPNRLDRLAENFERWRPLLGSFDTKVVLPQEPNGLGNGEFSALVGIIAADRVITVLRESCYLDNYWDHVVKPKVEFYKRLAHDGGFRDMLVVMPQPDTEPLEIPGIGLRRVVSRDRRAGRSERFGEITDKRHRFAIESFADGRPPTPLEDYASPGRAAMLLYLVRESRPRYDDARGGTANSTNRGLIAACSIWMPRDAIGGQENVVRFRVRNDAIPDQPTVDVP